MDLTGSRSNTSVMISSGSSGPVMGDSVFILLVALISIPAPNRSAGPDQQSGLDERYKKFGCWVVLGVGTRVELYK